MTALAATITLNACETQLIINRRKGRHVILHTEHLVPGMVLDKDIELRAGSFLITRRELGDGRLTEKAIKSIWNFSPQIVPVSNRVFIQDDKFTLDYIKNVVKEDLNRIAEGITSGKAYTNFLADGELQAKVMRVMEILLSKPDIVRCIYDAKFNFGEQDKALDLILDHSIRTAMLATAIGLRLRWTLLSLVSVATAALLHDLGILTTSPYPDLQSLDDLPADSLAGFIEKHQENSASLLENSGITMNPYQQREVLHIIANHHDPDLEDLKHRNTILFHFADLVDEMISLMPHSLRYNFSPAQLEMLGEPYKRRYNLIFVLLGLTRLYKRKGGLSWAIIRNMAALFNMKNLLGGNFDVKLQEIIESCPFDSAKVNPPLNGNSMPHTIYCSKCNDNGFNCEDLLHVKVNIQNDYGEMKEYLKCSALNTRLQNLVEQGEG